MARHRESEALDVEAQRRGHVRHHEERHRLRQVCDRQRRLDERCVEVLGDFADLSAVETKDPAVRVVVRAPCFRRRFTSRFDDDAVLVGEEAVRGDLDGAGHPLA